MFITSTTATTSIGRARFIAGALAGGGALVAGIVVAVAVTAATLPAFENSGGEMAGLGALLLGLGAALLVIAITLPAITAHNLSKRKVHRPLATGLLSSVFVLLTCWMLVLVGPGIVLGFPLLCGGCTWMAGVTVDAADITLSQLHRRRAVAGPGVRWPGHGDAPAAGAGLRLSHATAGPA